MSGSSGEMKLNYEKEIKKLSDTILNNKNKITAKEKEINIIISELDSQIAEREKQIIEDIKKISDNQSEENL
jgi:outer membrane lipopolysaccharide assembly protein LptE/RlpB